MQFQVCWVRGFNVGSVSIDQEVINANKHAAKSIQKTSMNDVKLLIIATSIWIKVDISKGKEGI